jgi:signal transduction histidine kinase
MILKNRVKSWSVLFEVYTWSLILIWSIVIGSMLVFGIIQIRQVQQEIVQKEARANFSKDQSIRLWATMHGGVYVPATAQTPPNPYLSHVQERDLETPSGIKLTLMNPAYMLRQTMDTYEIQYGIRGHITSLKHFSPETAPDAWEKDALRKFENGVKEVFDYEEIDGNPYYRFMAPMITKSACLKCHGHQGYKVGQVRGGVSVSVPMAPYLANQRRQTISYSISFSLLWVFGFIGIFLTSRGLKHRIWERDRAEETVRKNKEVLQTIFDGIIDPLVMLNANLEVRLLNKAASEYYLVDQESVLGKPCYQAFKARSKPCKGCHVPRAISSAQSIAFERKSFSGPYGFEKITIYRLKERNGEPKEFIIRIHDITERKLMEKQIIQSEKMASLGVLVSSVAHEINNPNTFVSFNIPILNDYIDEMMPIIDEYAVGRPEFEICNLAYPEFRRDIFKLLVNIKNGSDRISSFVSNLREYSQYNDKIPLTRVEIRDIIERVLSICHNKIKNSVKSFTKHVPDHLPPIYTEPDAIEQILINFLINASQSADKEDSWIKLSVSVNDAQEKRIWIEVRDNGSGMDEEIQLKVFDPFFTTKPPEDGTGLGLYVCHTLAERLNGRIEIESEPGEGSVFRLILPLKDPN